MRVWPIIVDSQPAYLRGNSRGTSLLLVPLGTGVLGEQVTSAVRVTFSPLAANCVSSSRMGRSISNSAASLATSSRRSCGLALSIQKTTPLVP